ncbi:cupin domain-containing protein [Nitriliruptor alkaliphilus]|uniref:cupin domain-containing protein n=1 Tax=Nitriliruptor alkaliphilus TaxID=427918 RepID=UPI000698F2A1|nr:hypothetical protein [Nitriliruptor alkaliphilus]
MGREVDEFVTYWGPSINEWGDGAERRWTTKRDLDQLQGEIAQGARVMRKVNVDEILAEGVETGVDMVNGFLPLVMFANEDFIVEVTNCPVEQGGWHRNLGADEWVFQYRGSRTIECESGHVTLEEGDMAVIPRGMSHRNVGHGPNIELTIYSRQPLKRLVPLDPAKAREKMRIKDGKPLNGEVLLEHAVIDRHGEEPPVPGGAQ